MSFSPNTFVNAKIMVHNILGILMVNWNESYLGLPIIAGKNKKMLFNKVKERVE